MTVKEAIQIPSDEATKLQLALARQQGETLGVALNLMLSGVAEDGQEIEKGPYLIGYAIEKAEGMYHRKDDGELVWREPGDDNIHIEVSVRDAADGRFIPYLDIQVRLIDRAGHEVGVHNQPFVWHPWLYHYGRNWRIEKGGDYTLEMNIKAPGFPRHDKKNGKRYTEDVEVSFSPVKIELN
jgi:hypothetical protein